MFARLARSILRAPSHLVSSVMAARGRRSHSLQLVDWLRDEPELGNGLLQLGRERRDDWQLCQLRQRAVEPGDGLASNSSSHGAPARMRGQEMHA